MGKEEVKEKKKKELTAENRKTIRVSVLLIGIVISLLAFLYFRKVYNDRGYGQVCGKDSQSNQLVDNENNSENHVLEQNEIPITDSNVTAFKNLFDYESTNMEARFPSIYSDTQVLAMELSSDQKKTIALHQYLRTNNLENVYVKCSEMRESDKFECNKDKNVLINGVLIYKHVIKGSDLSVSYQEIFGKGSASVITGVTSFVTPANIRCDYDGENFHCINLSETPVGIEVVTYPVKAYKYDNRMEILTKYVWIQDNKGYSNFHRSKTYFEGFVPKTELTTELNVKQNHDHQIDTFRHTFLKDQDGTYYWEKTEPAIN